MGDIVRNTDGSKTKQVMGAGIKRINQEKSSSISLGAGNCTVFQAAEVWAIDECH